MKIKVTDTRTGGGGMFAEIQSGKKRRWVGVKVQAGTSPKESIQNTMTALQAELNRQGVENRNWASLRGGES